MVGEVLFRVRCVEVPRLLPCKVLQMHLTYRSDTIASGHPWRNPWAVAVRGHPLLTSAAIWGLRVEGEPEISQIALQGPRKTSPKACR